MNQKTTSIQKPILIATLAAVLLFSGCAAMNPVVYPNGHAKKAGEEKLKTDIESCKQRADETVGHGNRSAKFARDGGLAVLVGAAAGAAFGWVYGGPGDALARGGATGAAGGAGSLVKNLLTMNEPDDVHQKFVEKCLKKKGYEVLGWR